MLTRKISLVLVTLATAVTPWAVALQEHSCADSSGYQFSLLSTELEGDQYVYRYLVKNDGNTTKHTHLKDWTLFLPESCSGALRGAGTCALAGEPTTTQIDKSSRRQCAGNAHPPANAIPSQCRTRFWKVGTSADIMTFQIDKSRVVDPTGGVVTVQSKSSQSGHDSHHCPTCQLPGPACASVSIVHSTKDQEPESVFYQWIRSLTVKTKTTSEDDKDKESKSGNSKTNSKVTKEDDKEKKSKSEEDKGNSGKSGEDEKEKDSESGSDKDKNSKHAKLKGIDSDVADKKDQDNKSGESKATSSDKDDDGDDSDDKDMDKGKDGDDADDKGMDSDDADGKGKDSDKADDKGKDGDEADGKGKDSGGKDTDDNENKEKSDEVSLAYLNFAVYTFQS